MRAISKIKSSSRRTGATGRKYPEQSIPVEWRDCVVPVHIGVKKQNGRSVGTISPRAIATPSMFFLRYSGPRTHSPSENPSQS